ncbi:hypothetical protein ACT048_20465 [Ectopseudomonas khazarica]|uniref:hypothetical protein n=1 Tax=Ectopseudomonas khazarica TaxID=2502979 RepID=UPI00403378EF
MNFEIRRYNAPRGTTLSESEKGELVIAADHDAAIDALRTQVAELRAENERLQLASNCYRVTLRSVLKDIRDDIARGGMAESWSGVAETISVVLEQGETAIPAPEAGPPLPGSGSSSSSG